MLTGWSGRIKLHNLHRRNQLFPGDMGALRVPEEDFKEDFPVNKAEGMAEVGNPEQLPTFNRIRNKISASTSNNSPRNN